MRVILTLSTIILTIFIPIAVISSVVLGLMFDVNFFRAGQVRYNVGQTTGLSLGQLDRVDRGIARFFASPSESLPQALTQSGANSDVFNQREILHMNDVRDIVQFIIRLDVASLLLFLAALVVDAAGWNDGGKRALARGFLNSSFVTLGLAVIVGVLSFFDFDQLFLTFHETVFKNNYWQLDPRTDHLIQMFPFEFWYDAMLTVAARVVAVIVVIGVSGFFLGRSGRKVG